MKVAGLDLLGGTNGGGTTSIGGSGCNGSLSTVSKAEVVEQDYVSGLSSEVSSTELDLGLGLSLGVGGNGGVKTKPCSWGEYGRILTAQDFPSSIIGTSGSGSSSSSSNSSGNKPAISTQKSPVSVSGNKRAADSTLQGTVSQVVGWPPIRTYRINNLVNQSKNPSVEDGKMLVENSKTKDSSDKTKNVQKKGQIGTLFVKVNMDGVPIGRKVDLNAHACYETLAETLDDMFFYTPSSTTKTSNFIRTNENGEAKKGSKLLGGSSEYVLTYEDKDGDWMLVGDVPWGMFLSTVKRLKIMRTSEANGLAPRFGGSNERPRNRPI